MLEKEKKTFTRTRKSWQSSEHIGSTPHQLIPRSPTVCSFHFPPSCEVQIQKPMPWNFTTEKNVGWPLLTKSGMVICWCFHKTHYLHLEHEISSCPHVVGRERLLLLLEMFWDNVLKPHSTESTQSCLRYVRGHRASVRRGSGFQQLLRERSTCALHKLLTTLTKAPDQFTRLSLIRCCVCDTLFDSPLTCSVKLVPLTLEVLLEMPRNEKTF